MEEEKQNPGGKAGTRRTVKLLLIALSVLAAGAVIGAVVYWNSMLNLLGDPEQTVPTLSQEEEAALLGTTESEAPTETTSPEETWPVVVSDENITNIMLVGQNFREDEQNKLSDTMILCSINRETKTLSMVSFMRDTYVKLPPYAGHGPGRNRMNVCYALGSSWTRTTEGGMEMLALCVEQNFGIPVHHTIEIGFDTFVSIIDVLGGVEVDVTEEEAKYMTEEVGYIGEVTAGEQILDGYETLAYARIREIDGDRQRTARQRTVIASLLEKARGMGLLELHDLATQILPMILTDMTNTEITNYIFEFLPMLKDLKIQSLTCPVDNETLKDSCWDKLIDLYGYPSYVLGCNTQLNGEYLREKLGMEPVEEG